MRVDSGETELRREAWKQKIRGRYVDEKNSTKIANGHSIVKFMCTVDSFADAGGIFGVLCSSDQAKYLAVCLQ